MGASLTDPQTGYLARHRRNLTVACALSTGEVRCSGCSRRGSVAWAGKVGSDSDSIRWTGTLRDGRDGLGGGAGGADGRWTGRRRWLMWGTRPTSEFVPPRRLVREALSPGAIMTARTAANKRMSRQGRLASWWLRPKTKNKWLDCVRCKKYGLLLFAGVRVARKVGPGMPSFTAHVASANS